MRRFLFGLFLVGSLSAACSPKIGDECSSSIDCSSVGDRLCDTSQPGGYCTLFNCEPDSCPDDAVCVAFHHRDSQTYCDDRFQRSFCMASCSNNEDCRAGYSCLNAGEPGNSYGAVVLEHGKTNAKVCLATQTLAPGGDEPPPICTGEKGGTPPEPLEDNAGSGADAGAGDAATDASEEVDSGAPADDAGDGGGGF